MSWKDSGFSENANIAIPMQAFMDLSEKNWTIVRYGISHLYPMPPNLMVATLGLSKFVAGRCWGIRREQYYVILTH